MFAGIRVKYPFFLSDFNETWIFRQIFENTQISNFMGIRPVGGVVFYADGETDGRTDRHDEADSRFSQFCERVV
jgi:hypothetical protein